VPDAPLSHPFVERPIGTVRRECLDRTLFWTTTDLEAKLLDFQHYYNEHRTHAPTPRAPAGNGRQRRSLTGKPQLLSMERSIVAAYTKRRLPPDLVIRHRQDGQAEKTDAPHAMLASS